MVDVPSSKATDLSKSSKIAHREPVNTGRWTKAEHEAFVQGLNQHGREWKKVAQLIPSRTVVQIRTHAQKYFQKLAKEGALHEHDLTDRKRRREDPATARKRVLIRHRSYAAESELPPPPAGADTSTYRERAQAAGMLVTGLPAGEEMAPPPSFRVRRGSTGSGPSPANEEPITPRTIQAAMSLVKNRTRGNLEQGRDTPRTRQMATWLAGMGEDDETGYDWRAAVAGIQEDGVVTGMYDAMEGDDKVIMGDSHGFAAPLTARPPSNGALPRSVADDRGFGKLQASPPLMPRTPFGAPAAVTIAGTSSTPPSARPALPGMGTTPLMGAAPRTAATVGLLRSPTSSARGSGVLASPPRPVRVLSPGLIPPSAATASSIPNFATTSTMGASSSVSAPVSTSSSGGSTAPSGGLASDAGGSGGGGHMASFAAAAVPGPGPARHMSGIAAGSPYSGPPDATDPNIVIDVGAPAPPPMSGFEALPPVPAARFAVPSAPGTTIATHTNLPASTSM